MPQETRQHPDKPNYFQIFEQVGIPTEYEKTKPDLITLKDYYSCPVFILGGGPSLPDDLAKVDIKKGIAISVNHHAFKLVTPDYMVFQDAPEHQDNSEFNKLITGSCPCPKISPRIKHTDYYCVNEYPFDERISDSGRFAVWVASYISTGPIYLLGIGLRDPREPMHFYIKPDKVGAEWGGPPMNRKIEQWLNIISKVQNQIIAVSGPLSEYFPLNPKV